MAASTTLAALAACGGRSGPAQPVPADAAPAAADSVATDPRPLPSPAAEAVRPPHPADIAFLRGMIAHHAQAVVMTDMVAARTENQAIHNLAGRIDVSQKDEIERMRHWLTSRGLEAPDPLNAGGHAHHGQGDHGLMPGMLTQQELDRLAAVEGAAFDRLFLESMIRHHEGALVMVAELFATEGAGGEPELYIFANHIDADQRAEIQRMSRLLAAMPSGQE